MRKIWKQRQNFGFLFTTFSAMNVLNLRTILSHYQFVYRLILKKLGCLKKSTLKLLTNIMIISLLLFSTQMNAMRCDNQDGNYIVQTGDDMAEVMMKCGKPNYQYEPGLLLDEEVWVYKQDGGAIYNVKFLQGQVSDIDFSRLN